MAEQTNVPPRGRRRWSPRVDRGLTARWPFFFLLAMAAVSLLLHAAKYRRGLEIAERQRQYSELVRARPIAEIKAARARFYRLQYFLGYPMAASHAAADLVRRLGRAAPPLRLLAVQVDPGLQDLGFELTIEVSGGRPRDVRRRLAFFIERLRVVPNVTAADPSGPGPTARGGGARVFTVSGRAEIQP